MNIVCDKAFPFITKVLNFDLDRDLRAIYRKSLLCAITLEPLEVGLLYFTCIFLVMRFYIHTKFLTL